MHPLKCGCPSLDAVSYLFQVMNSGLAPGERVSKEDGMGWDGMGNVLFGTTFRLLQELRGVRSREAVECGFEGGEAVVDVLWSTYGGFGHGGV